MGAGEIAGEAMADSFAIEELDGNPRLPQPIRPLSLRAGVRILATDYRARDARIGQQVGAGRAARRTMGAGLQRAVKGSAARRRAGLGQRHRFGVGATARLRPAAPDHSAILDQQCADGRVGCGGGS